LLSRGLLSLSTKKKKERGVGNQLQGIDGALPVGKKDSGKNPERQRMGLTSHKQHIDERPQKYAKKLLDGET